MTTDTISRAEVLKVIDETIDTSGVIYPIEEANDIFYGTQNDTLQMAYARGMNEIIGRIMENKEELKSKISAIKETLDKEEK